MKREKILYRQIMWILVCALMLAPLLAACSRGGQENDNEERVLRIGYMYGDPNYDDFLHMQYTDLFEFTHKNITIEFVPAIDYSQRRFETPEPGAPYEEPNGYVAMKELMNSDNPPDLVMVDLETLALLIQENMLEPLDAYIQQDDFDIDGIVPAVRNKLQELGNGQLYALAPTFSSNAIVYNVGLFNERGVALPTDDMTWDELFDLARQMSYGEGSERVYGLGFGRSFYTDIFTILDYYISPLELRVMDENMTEMLVDSESWQTYLGKIVDLHREKVFPEPDENGGIGIPRPLKTVPDAFSWDAFLSGRLAMAILNYYDIIDIITTNQNAHNIEGYEPIEWDLVALPTHPEAPGIGGLISMDPIMGINARAQNAKDAWEFLKFINGEEWAEFKARNISMMVSREKYIQPYGGLDYNIEAFYKLTPATSSLNSFNPQVDPAKRTQIWMIHDIGRQKIEQVVKEGKDLKQALQEWQTEGTAYMKDFEENPNNGGIFPIEPLPEPDVIIDTPGG